VEKNYILAHWGAPFIRGTSCSIKSVRFGALIMLEALKGIRSLLPESFAPQVCLWHNTTRHFKPPAGPVESHKVALETSG